MVHLVQIFLPTHINDQQSALAIDREVKLLADEFGGATAFVNSPASGMWTDDDRHHQKDVVILIEIMAPIWDAVWWSAHKRDLELIFDQEKILIRRTACEILE